MSLSIERARNGDWNVALLGRARVVTDPDRMPWGRGWLFDRYDGADEDGSATVGAGDSGEETASGYTLVEVAVGSASASVFE